MSSPASVSKTHNLPPIVAPIEEDVAADLKARFPELETEYADFEAALKTFPNELNLSDGETAAALQDLLGKVKKHKSVIAAHKKTEKGPWSTVVNVVTNFFDRASKRLADIEEKWAPVHQSYMDKVKAENLRKANEGAERQRKIEEENRRKAEEASAARAAAEKAEADARQREADARAAAEEAERKQREAEARAAEAAAEEKRLAKEKADRDRAEKEKNETNLREIRRHLKQAAKLEEAIGEAGDEAAPDDIAALDALIRPGGMVSVLAGPVAVSMLLDDEQTAEIAEIKVTLEGMRATQTARLDAKAKRKRAAELKAQQAAEEKAAEARRIQREQDEARTKAAQEAREKAEADAKAAKEAGQAAKGEIRDARSEARGAQQEQKSAGKVERQAGTDADRAANRADRIEDKLEKATDAEIAGTLRGELGTRGSLTRNWTLKIVDEEALRAVCGPIGAHFTQDALNGAAYRWMRAHQAGWAGRERVEGELPGVLFMYQQGARIG